MPRPQFSLFSILALLTISCGICAVLAALVQHPHSGNRVTIEGLNPPLRGVPFPDIGTGLVIPYTPKWWHESAGGFWIRGTIAASLAMVAVSWCILLSVNSPQDQNRARWSWTLALVFYLVHVAAAFALVHHWSHTEAEWHTALRTYEATGWLWAGGIWINYVFTLVWAADVIYWWSGLERYARRPVRLRWFVHAFFAFMIFQAGVVFAAGPIRWLTLAGLLTVAFLGLVRLARPPQQEFPRV